MQKGVEANLYRYTTNLYWYRRAGFRQKGFLTPFFAPFGIHNLIHPLQNKTLALFTLSHKQPQVCLLLLEFPSLRLGFFCTHRTDVVSLLQFLESVFVIFIIIHGFAWLVLVGGFFFLVVGWFGVHLQPVPVHLCRKVAESNLYRYTFSLYRYTHAKK